MFTYVSDRPHTQHFLLEKGIRIPLPARHRTRFKHAADREHYEAQLAQCTSFNRRFKKHHVRVVEVPRKHPIKELDVGESFAVSFEDMAAANRFRALVRVTARSTGKIFVVRTDEQGPLEPNGHLRVWRIA